MKHLNLIRELENLVFFWCPYLYLSLKFQTISVNYSIQNLHNMLGIIWIKSCAWTYNAIMLNIISLLFVYLCVCIEGRYILQNCFDAKPNIKHGMTLFFNSLPCWRRSGSCLWGLSRMSFKLFKIWRRCRLWTMPGWFSYFFYWFVDLSKYVN